MRVVEKTKEGQTQQTLNTSVKSEVVPVVIEVESPSNQITGTVNEGCDSAEVNQAGTDQGKIFFSEKFLYSDQDQQTPSPQLNFGASTPLTNNDRLIENVPNFAFPQISEETNDNESGAESLPENTCQEVIENEKELIKVQNSCIEKEKKWKEKKLTMANQNSVDNNSKSELSASLSLENISSGASSMSEVQLNPNKTDRRLISMELTLCDISPAPILEKITKNKTMSETGAAFDEQEEYQSNIAAKKTDKVLPIDTDIQ